MNPSFAERVKSIKQSDIRRFSAICAAMGGVNLSQGVCDQPAPDAALRPLESPFPAGGGTLGRPLEERSGVTPTPVRMSPT